MDPWPKVNVPKVFQEGFTKSDNSTTHNMHICVLSLSSWFQKGIWFRDPNQFQNRSKIWLNQKNFLLSPSDRADLSENFELLIEFLAQDLTKLQQFLELNRIEFQNGTKIQVLSMMFDPKLKFRSVIYSSRRVLRHLTRPC